ncbi:LacI family transcriptional regulator [bacterium]|nr:MAG: LacI family transcriptional regulator [bacterium]
MANPSRNVVPKSGRPKTVTLEDVAKHAGVGTMTASRAIKGTGYVAAATKEKVLRSADALNYTTNFAARSLATGKTGIIAVMCGPLNELHHVNVVHLLETEINKSGYQMRLLHTKTDLKEIMHATRATSADGVLAYGVQDLSDEFEFLNSKLLQHCVFIDTYEHPGADYVRIDLRGAVEEAVTLMLSSGRPRIAYAGYSNGVSYQEGSAVEDRLITFVASMQRAGREIEYINAWRDLPYTGRIQALRRYFEENGCPGGILCLHDEIATLIYRALRDCGRRIPEDTLLVGCDGLPFMECYDPPLSVVAQPMAEVCATAWQFLKARMADSRIPLQQKTFEAPLIVRESLNFD